jgi:hypothetical protein
MDDYLKYWRVIRQYVKIKYELNQADLDMILFLYSEVYFSKDKFTEFTRLVGWDSKRFKRLQSQGLIESFRKYDPQTKRRAVYKLSYKATRMVNMIYKYLRGEEIISESYKKNPLFKKNKRYRDAVMRGAVLQLNDSIRQLQQQRHAPE